MAKRAQQWISSVMTAKGGGKLTYIHDRELAFEYVSKHVSPKPDLPHKPMTLPTADHQHQDLIAFESELTELVRSTGTPVAPLLPRWRPSSLASVPRKRTLFADSFEPEDLLLTLSRVARRPGF